MARFLSSVGLGSGLGIFLFAAACGSGSSTLMGSGSSGSGNVGGNAPGTTDGSSTTTTASGGDTGGGSSGGCMKDVECPMGTVCKSGSCVPECPDCKGTCCGGDCVDLTTSLIHCGKCDNSCPQPANIDASCTGGVCKLGQCKAGSFDCDGDASTGCESNAPCACKPGEAQPCYPGPQGTEGKGACKAGTRKCNKAGTAWSLCADFVVPTTEICNNGADEDCDGKSDNSPDLDGDGWSACDNDCCENTNDCAEPKKVNPGAFEWIGNMVDDDCDPNTSDSKAPAACSTKSVFGGVTAQQMADAMELCQVTTANPPLSQKKWGVVSAEFRTPDGKTPGAGQATTMSNQQTAILIDYGTGGIKPQKGATMAGMSSGAMRDQNDPGYTNPNGGSGLGYYGSPPAAYLAANGNQLPSSAGCNGTCPAGSGANDGVNLRLQIRVPTNALSFSYQFRFFSAEYWTWSCTAYNDFYLALLTSGAANLPKDKNISFDSKKNPVSVNNGFFDLCTKKGCYTCPSGTAALAGTGMQLNNTGGGTEWLKTTAPVVPGETMILELMVFDVSDGVLDSLALLDAFEWSISASSVGTGPPG